MNRVSRLPAILISTTIFLFLGFFVMANSAYAALLKLNPSSDSVDGSTQIQLVLDTQGEAIDSSVAVITYDPNRIEKPTVTAGSYFDSVVVDSSTSGEVAITATLNIGNIDGVTGSGTIATLTVTPKITSGEFALGYRCSAADIDDSNIMSVGGENLLATDVQCADNIGGNYTIAAASNDTEDDSSSDTTEDSEETTKGDQPVLPDELPESGFKDLLKWITSGLALVGIGLLLL